MAMTFWMAKPLRMMTERERERRTEMAVKVVPRTEMVMKLTMVFSASSP